MRKLAIVISAAVLTLALMVMGTGCAPPMPAKPVVTVGNKNFTEQYVVGQLMKQLLEARGFKVDLVSDLTSMALRAGLEAGDIDIAADYTGTAWMVHLGREYKPGIDNNELLKKVREADKKNGFIWLNPMWNNNTYALASWPKFIEKHNLKTLSDLAALYREKEGKISTFIDYEFSVRPDGLPALQKHYNFKVAEATLKTGAPGASLIALKEHETKVGMVFGTDPHIVEYGWYVYEDDKAFFPPYDLTPYSRIVVLKKYPEIKKILNELVATFPGGGKPFTPERLAKCRKVWQELNGNVDIKKMEPDEVAREYLVKKGLIKG